jgi:hypothetical protein
LMVKAKKEKLLNLVEFSSNNQKIFPIHVITLKLKADFHAIRHSANLNNQRLEKSIAKIVSMAEGVMTTIDTFEIKEEAAIQA